MPPADPDRLSEGADPAAALLSAYAARSRSAGDDEGAAWQRLQPVLDARLPQRRRWLQTRVLAGAFTVAMGLFVLARSAPWGERVLPRPEAVGRTIGPRSPDATLGGGGASGALDGDSRGIGGMEGASGAGTANRRRRAPPLGVPLLTSAEGRGARVEVTLAASRGA